MSYRNRKILNESFTRRLLKTEALLTYQDLMGEKNGLLKGVEDVGVLDSAKKACLIRLINETFLDDAWLDKAEIKTGEMSFPEIGCLLTRGVLSGDIADNIIADYEEHYATLVEVADSIEEQNTKILDAWNEFICIASHYPKLTDEESPIVSQAIGVLDNVRAVVLENSPAKVFNSPKNILGCCSVKYNGEEYTATTINCDTSFSALNKEQIKKLAGHILDTIDDFSYTYSLVEKGPTPITESNLGDELNSNFWWDFVASNHDFRTVTSEESFKANLPLELLHYSGGTTSVVSNYHRLVVALILSHVS